MAWVYLLFAGILECVWAVALKYTAGFTRIVPVMITVVANVASVALLALAVRKIPLGGAYAIWTGIGVVGTVCAGIFLFAENFSIAKAVCLTMIVGGIVGLRLLN